MNALSEQNSFVCRGLTVLTCVWGRKKELCLLEVQHLKGQVPKEQALVQNLDRFILNNPAAKTLEDQNDSPII